MENKIKETESIGDFISREFINERLSSLRNEIIKNIEKELYTLFENRVKANEFYLIGDYEQSNIEKIEKLLELKRKCSNIETFKTIPTKDLKEFVTSRYL